MKVCAPAEDCPTSCGYGGGTVPDGNCGTTTCEATDPCCTPSDPEAPTLFSPAEGTQVRVGVATILDWNDIVSWGVACPANDNKYNVCLSSNQVSCDLGYPSTSTTSQYSWTPVVADPIAYWAAIADNGALTGWSTTRSVCVEGGAVLGTWSACDANHERTATCTETCGTDDCTALGAVGGVITEDCVGTITGTLFDASDLAYCPGDIGTNPGYASLRYSNEAFGLTGTWPVISLPVSTDANGNYSESVYASTLPAVYTYDYIELFSSGRAAGIKFECQSPVATVTDQSQIVTKDTGFWRVFGGWWQAAGGSVYAKSGIKSSIPVSVTPVGDQKLILADTNGRSGMLSYGVPWAGTELGTNPDARVSTPLWRIESVYEGLRYDYNFYNTRMDVFAFTAWDGGAVIYDDGGKGYQIFKHTGNVTLSYGGPTGTQKVILLIDGNVNINSNVVVPDGAFFGVVASGNITFGSAVANAQGWFVAENINVPCEDTAAPLGTCDKTDVQFAGEGSFAGWTGINLARDRYTTNNQEPSEKFTYRPDMLLNIPTPMKVYTRKFSPFIP